MGEPKPLASLTSGLLARKGGARPAMRRQPLGSGPANPAGNGYDDLGWNDMGYDVDPVQSGEMMPRVDIKSLLTGSMPAHNHDAEAAVYAADPIRDISEGSAELTPFPGVGEQDADHVAEKPEIVRQQEGLQVRVASAQAAAVAEIADTQPIEAPVETPVEAEVAVPAPKTARRAAAPRAARAAKLREKAAFTLRLDAERHLRLRLASAIYNRSAQHILIAVLDDYLSALPEIDAMASRLPASPTSRKPTHNLVGDDQ